MSKQVAGQMFIHGLNVVISDLGSQQFSGDACTYYFLNILVDTTLGKPQNFWATINANTNDQVLADRKSVV